MARRRWIHRGPRLLVAALGCALATLVASAQPALTPAAYQSLAFRYIGLPGNRVNAVAGVAGDPNIIYAGTPSGGIFKSADGGLKWQPVFDEQIVASIGAIAVARSDAKVVWAGTGDPNIRPNIEIGNGVYKSTDAGRTWSHTGLDETGRIGRIAIDPRNPSVVFVAAMGHCYGPQQQRGVFRTRDAGKTWERVLFVDERTGAIDVVIDQMNPRNVFAATWQLMIYPWFSESGGPGSGIYVSRDGGTTWTRLTGRGLPASPLGRSSIVISPSNPKRVYALIEHAKEGNLFRSDDGGENWTIASRNPAINRRARYFSRLGVSPDNPDEVYFLAQAVYQSFDAGATTTMRMEMFPDSHDIWFDPLNGNRLIIASDRYVNISTTRARSWFHVPLPASQVNRVATDRRFPYNVYGSRQDGPAYRGPSNSLLRSTGGAGGESASGLIPPDFWVWTIGAESGWVMPDRSDDNIIWVSSSNNVEHIDMRTGIMQGSTPFPRTPGGGGGGGGQPVAERQYRRNWTIPLAMSPHDPRKIYVGSQYVHQSPDGGETWSVISPDLTTNDKSKQQVPPGLYPETQDVPCTLIYIEESPIEPGVIWTGSNDGVVSLTRDGGKNWTNVTANMPVEAWGWVYSIAPSRHAFGTAYATVDRHRAADNSTYVFKTEDYGRTWKSIGSGIPKSVFAYARVVREDPRRKGMLYLGTENGLYLSVDDGASWMPLQNNLPHSPIAWLTVQEDFDDLVVATWGRGFWILDDIGPLRQLTPAVLGSRAYLFDPRPAFLFAFRDPTTSESFLTEYDPPSHVGHNPPYGASITYYLSTPASSEARLTIRDEKNASIRTLTGTKASGLNRVWWDLRSTARTTTTATATNGDPPQSEAPGGGQRQTNPLVAPGVYTVTLAVDGRELTTKLTVRKDPERPLR
ncbi:MAG TPA: hypothetical protein VEK56_08885 [Vicinamibacterales bacterium]|nr:hypothetical protein [Vicinamibacterales bacterium]